MELKTQPRGSPRGDRCAWNPVGTGCFWGSVDTRTPPERKVPSSAAARLDWVYARSCDIIRSHLGDPDLDVERVVANVGASRPTVYRAFAQQQQTVAGVIRRLRLESACKMLATPPFNVPIETLAYRCGFEDARTFHRAFRRQFGVSAGEFRRLALAGIAGQAPDQTCASTQPLSKS